MGGEQPSGTSDEGLSERVSGIGMIASGSFIESAPVHQCTNRIAAAHCLFTAARSAPRPFQTP